MFPVALACGNDRILNVIPRPQIAAFQDVFCTTDFRKFLASGHYTNVRFWLLADLLPGRDLGPLYPRKRTFFSTGVYVWF